MKRRSKAGRTAVQLNLDLQVEVIRLRDRIAKMQVELDFREQLKDEAFQKYVTDSISAWNSAVRSTNGPRPNETPAQYQQRLIEANRKQ